MSSSLSSVIEHYKRKMERHSNEPDVLLYALGKLDRLYGVSISVLQDTGIGRTVNALKKHPEDPRVADQAKALVAKWKQIVANEEEEEEVEQNVPPPPATTNSSSPDSGHVEEEYEPAPPPPPPMPSNHSPPPPMPDHLPPIEEDEDLPPPLSPPHATLSPPSSSHRSGGYDPDSQPREATSLSNPVPEESSSSSHRHHKKSKSKRKAEEAPEEKKDRRERDKKRHKKDKERDADKDKDRDKSRSSGHSGDKDKRSKDKHRDKDKDHHRSSSSSSSSRSKKQKSLATSSAFDEALSGGSRSRASENTSVASSSSSSHRSSSSSKKSSSSTTNGSSSSKRSRSPTPPTPPSSAAPSSGASTPSVPANLTPNYKPLSGSSKTALDISNGLKDKIKGKTDDEALSELMAMNKSKSAKRTAVYSGSKRTGYFGEVPSLMKMCIHVLQENVDDIGECGGLGYDVMGPVLERASPETLMRIEEYNPNMMVDTPHLWQRFCNRHFPKAKREEMESWREMFERCTLERETKLSQLKLKVQASYKREEQSQKKTKVAYVGLVAKPPRQVMRAQARHGTGLPASMEVKARPSSSGGPPRPGSSVAPAPNAFPAKKPKVAPMMAKTLKLVKGMKMGFRR